jgi:hypothetical protein
MEVLRRMISFTPSGKYDFWERELGAIWTARVADLKMRAVLRWQPIELISVEKCVWRQAFTRQERCDCGGRESAATCPVWAADSRTERVASPNLMDEMSETKISVGISGNLETTHLGPMGLILEEA